MATKAIAQTTRDIFLPHGPVIRAGQSGEILRRFPAPVDPGEPPGDAVLVSFGEWDPADPKGRRKLPPVHLYPGEWRILDEEVLP